MLRVKKLHQFKTPVQVLACQDEKGCFNSGKKAAVSLALQAAKFGKATLGFFILGKKYIKHLRTDMGSHCQQQYDPFIVA